MKRQNLGEDSKLSQKQSVAQKNFPLAKVKRKQSGGLKGEKDAYIQPIS